MFVRPVSGPVPATVVLGVAAGAPASSFGFVYVMTNQPGGNTVIQYGRANDGSLTKVHEVSTAVPAERAMASERSIRPARRTRWC